MQNSVVISFQANTPNRKLVVEKLKESGRDSFHVNKRITEKIVKEALLNAYLEGYEEAVVLIPYDRLIESLLVNTVRLFEKEYDISGFSVQLVNELKYLKEDDAPTESVSKRLTLPKQGGVLRISLLNANLPAKGLDQLITTYLQPIDQAMVQNKLPTFFQNGNWDKEAHSRVYLLPGTAGIEDRPLSPDIRRTLLLGGAGFPGLYGANGISKKLPNLVENHLISGKKDQISQALIRTQKELRAPGLLIQVPSYMSSSQEVTLLKEYAEGNENVELIFVEAGVDNPTGSREVIQLGLKLADGGDLSKTEPGEFNVTDENGNTINPTMSDLFAIYVITFLRDTQAGKLSVEADTGSARLNSLGDYLKGIMEAIPKDIQEIGEELKQSSFGAVAGGTLKLAKAIGNVAKKQPDGEEGEDTEKTEQAKLEAEEKMKKLYDRIKGLGLDIYKILRQPQFKQFKQFFDLPA